MFLKMSMFNVLVLEILLLVVVADAARTPKVLNETCIEDGSVGYVGGSPSGVLRTYAYQDSCPDAESIIFSWVENAVLNDPRMAASLLRLHFHDCFVNVSLLSDL